ncbi:MAG: hypothetical protein PUD16_01470, partial [bacterium]|nr:hypothetical protein [bacterium]
MKQCNLSRAVERYNSIMLCVGADHLTIGLSCSEETEKWNLRDMVSECAYILSTYYDHNHSNYDLKADGDAELIKIWRSETGKLRRFIAAYEPFISNLCCAEEHGSKYDNPEDIAFSKSILCKAL